MQIPLTPIALVALANAALAGLFAVIPTWRARFVSWDADKQTAVFGLWSIGLGVVLMLASCTGLITGLTCTGADLTTYFVGVVLSSIGGIHSAKAAFVVARLTDKRRIDSKNAGRPVGIPHTIRPKMLD